VELLSVESYFHVYKSSLSQSRQFKIRVKDFGQGEEKNIIVHGELDSGAWMDISGADDAVYLGEAGEGFHLYEINLYDYIQPYIDNWGDSFVIKYVSDQGTFWIIITAGTSPSKATTACIGRIGGQCPAGNPGLRLG
jgi:hypothetical protein